MAAASDPHKQLPLAFPAREVLSLEDFLVASSNENAVELIDQWPNWSANAMLISGPEGGGKSHLANVWRLKAEAKLIESQHLAPHHAMEHEGTSLVIEDVDQGIGNEKALFHLLNMAKEEGFFILFTARTMPGQWQISLPDLRSRLRSLSVVTIGMPDDQLLKTVLIKQFHDRQITIDPKLVSFLLKRIERSLAAVRDVVELLDKSALAKGRAITPHLAREVLEEHFDMK